MSSIAPPRPPAWRRIAHELADSIGRGDHSAGDTLPAATEVAEKYGVHRHTVRQAYLHLQDLGLVSIERGRGTLVTNSKFPYRIGRRVSFRDNVRASGLEASGEIVRAYVTRGPASACALLGLAPDADLWRIRTLNSAGGARVSTALHHLDAARFPDFGNALRAARASITGALRALGIADYQRLSTRVSARPATDDEATLLDIAPGAPLLRTLGVDGDLDGAPLHVADTLFAADRVEFVIEPEARLASDRPVSDDGEAEP